MKTIRRIYFYAVALISMEIVLWGMIGLTRSIFSDSSGGVTQLALALALIAVGVPVFGIHWWAAQRSANQDEEERNSGMRALFLYAALIGLLIPLTQNGLAIVNRLTLKLFDISFSQAIFGGYQSLSDNLIAALFNGFVGAYFFKILQKEWHEVPDKTALKFTRRTYRYIWVLYALIISISGVNQILRYLFSSISDISGNYENAFFANGLAFTLVGIPLWVFVWKNAQDALQDPAEKASLLRLGVLYFLALTSVLFVLSATGFIIDELLQSLLNGKTSFRDFFYTISDPLALAVPLGAVWAYYGHWLQRDLSALPSAPRRAALRRFYYYILSLVGLGAAFSGLMMLFTFIIDTALASSVANNHTQLANALSTLFVGLPLWLFTWRPMQRDALAEGEAGISSRRSIIRKIYLYLAIFVGVVGGMVAGVQLISVLLEKSLGANPYNFANKLLSSIQMLILFGGLLAYYHWQSLRRDGILHHEILKEKVRAFTVLLFNTGGDETPPSELASLVDTESEAINIILQNPAETIPPADAAILPETLAFDSPEMLKSWLRDFNGSKFIVKSEANDWYWAENIQQIKRSLRQLAEGEEVKLSQKSPGWMIAVYILAGMMGLEILFFLLLIAFDGF